MTRYPGFFTCPVCECSQPDPATACNNPGCTANPAVTPATRAMWAALDQRRDRDAADLAFRQRMYAISFIRNSGG